jgi:hypothetical protein
MPSVSRKEASLTVLAVILAVGVILGCLSLSAFVTNVNNYELAFSFDRYNNGKIEVIRSQGWVVRMPIRYSVHTIDLRPYQITLSANQRVLNAKLVQFNPEGLETFVKWHGREAGDKTDNLLEILKCYAFDRAEGRDCPFLTVLQEIAPNQAGVVNEIQK